MGLGTFNNGKLHMGSFTAIFDEHWLGGYHFNQMIDGRADNSTYHSFFFGKHQRYLYSKEK